MVLPAAEIVETATLADARTWLTVTRIDFLLAGSVLSDGDTLDLLTTPEISPRLPRRVMIITGSLQPHGLAQLHGLPVAGIFDVAEGGIALEGALRHLADGRTYRSQSVLDQLHCSPKFARIIHRQLTSTERLVLSALADGSDDLAVAQLLDLAPSSVQSVRRNLHRKLGVQQKGELIRLAAQFGCVRFTADKVFAPGFGRLFSAWRSCRRKPGQAIGK